jgi:F0F1-type ATP synthase epsilon subunit
MSLNVRIITPEKVFLTSETEQVVCRQSQVE